MKPLHEWLSEENDEEISRYDRFDLIGIFTILISVSIIGISPTSYLIDRFLESGEAFTTKDNLMRYSSLISTMSILLTLFYFRRNVMKRTHIVGVFSSVLLIYLFISKVTLESKIWTWLYKVPRSAKFNWLEAIVVAVWILWIIYYAWRLLQNRSMSKHPD